jgi:porphobilinogen synthase
MDITKRPRRLRVSSGVRNLVKETVLLTNDLVYPMFIVNGVNIRKEIPAMPGVYQFSIDNFLKELKEVEELGIKGVLLFGVPDEKDKDKFGSLAYDENGLIQRALIVAKNKFPELVLIADVCLCAYTNHGHCGVVIDGNIINDSSTELIGKVALSYAKAGADIVAPSDMMDGRVRAIRNILDNNGYENVSILSYSAKYASSFYGPFREAANSAPSFGDRKTYQMDYCNSDEAIREIELDIDEGADIVMVKPALSYLDVICRVEQLTYVPVAAYHVSGEYSMIKAAAKCGWINEKEVVLEAITSIKRAGANIIITYYAKDLAKWIKE